MLNIDEIRNILPQRYPFLMIDRVIEYHEERLVATKNFTADEWFFPARANDTVPEAFLMEAASQAAIVLTHLYKGKEKKGPVPQRGTGPFGFSSSDDPVSFQPLIGKIKAEFLDSVSIGQELKIRVSINKLMSDKGLFDARLSVGEKTVADIEIFAVLKHQNQGVPHG